MEMLTGEGVGGSRSWLRPLLSLKPQAPPSYFCFRAAVGQVLGPRGVTDFLWGFVAGIILYFIFKLSLESFFKKAIHMY